MAAAIGTDSCFISNIQDALNEASVNKQNFLVTPLVKMNYSKKYEYETYLLIFQFHPRFRRNFATVSSNRSGPGTRSDTVLESKDWIANIVGKISEVIL